MLNKKSNKINSSIETEDYEVALNRKPFFQKIFAYLNSSRKISHKKINDTLQIKYFLITGEDIKKNWHIILFLIIGFCVLPILLGVSQVLIELIRGKEENRIMINCNKDQHEKTLKTKPP